jgi:hypothetical protein
VPIDVVGDLRLYRRIRTTTIPVAVPDAGRAQAAVRPRAGLARRRAARIDRLPAATYYGARA